MNSGRVSNQTDGGAALSTVVSRLRCLLSGPCRFPLSLFRFPSAPIHLLLPTLAASPVSLDTFSLGRYKSHICAQFRYFVLLTMANPRNIRGAPAGDAEAAEHAEPSTSPQEDAGGNPMCFIYLFSYC